MPSRAQGAKRFRVPPIRTRVQAVLLDRDGTIIRDVPHNSDPTRVEPMPGARAALDRLRRARLRLGVVSNQSGVGRGLITAEQMRLVNARVEALLGRFDVWAVCTHEPYAGCGCRKPAPGLIVEAARRLGLTPADCVVIGDIGSDMAAARAAGSCGILVPTPRTRSEEIAVAPCVVADLGEAVDLILEAMR
ncbi:D-glycero-alpha-D-manno-heptose-1,7-bisphosphate 7-phosphatase [Carbonactinospora thermoautotrophica]|nr:HAD-IIIA family hydrolase [Carbonactinospora thermoautotrophica]